MKSSEDDLIESMNCDHNWPVCLFDFTYKNTISDYFAFRVKKFNVINDHFCFDSVESDKTSSKEL